MIKQNGKKIQVRTFKEPFTRKIRHCKTCEHKCDMKPPVVGCESIMAPGYFEWKGNVYTMCCVKRTWFNKNYTPVQIWDSTKITCDMTPEKFWKLMDEELRKAQAKAGMK